MHSWARQSRTHFAGPRPERLSRPGTVSPYYGVSITVFDREVEIMGLKAPLAHNCGRCHHRARAHRPGALSATPEDGPLTVLLHRPTGTIEKGGKYGKFSAAVVLYATGHSSRHDTWFSHARLSQIRAEPRFGRKKTAYELARLSSRRRRRLSVGYRRENVGTKTSHFRRSRETLRS
jgi:hypothetical protein